MDPLSLKGLNIYYICSFEYLVEFFDIYVRILIKLGSILSYFFFISSN